MRNLFLAAALAGLSAQPLLAQETAAAAAPAAAPLGLFIDGKGPNGMSDLPMGVNLTAS